MSFDLQGFQQSRFFEIYLAGLWFLYLVASPLYIFHEGLPQPAAIVLMFGVLPWAAFSAVNNRSTLPLAYIAGGLFAGLTFFINWVNFAFIPDQRFALSSIYYLFNFIIFVFAVSLFRKNYDLMIRLTCAGIIIALCTQCLWAEFLPDPGARRMTAGFKNPNQLAYWALLCMAILVYMKQNSKFNLIDFFALLTGAYIQTLALSKAGIIAASALLVLIFFMPQMPKVGRYAGYIAALVTCVYLLFAPQSVPNLSSQIDSFNRVTERLDNVGAESDDSLEGRGYTRISENPIYLLIGAGEGGFERFRTWSSPKELHSGLATILFSYGIFGFCLFCAFLGCIFYRQPWYCWGILFCVMLFSLSSQTIRFNHTWIFFAVAYASFIYRPSWAARKNNAPAPDAMMAVANGVST